MGYLHPTVAAPPLLAGCLLPLIESYPGQADYPIAAVEATANPNISVGEGETAGSGAKNR